MRLQKLIKQFQGIASTSRNPEMVARAKKEVKTLTDQLEALGPAAASVSAAPSSGGRQGINDILRSTQVLSRYTVRPASQYCLNDEVNLIALALQAWEEDFSRAMSESHIKLDFAHSAERESHFHMLGQTKRSLDILLKTYEDYVTALKEEYKNQFREVRNRNTRQFLYEAAATLKKIKLFWEKVGEDIRNRGNICLNLDEVIEYDRKIENPNFLENKTVPEVVSIAITFLSEVLDLLNLPELPSNQA